jgi:hypothetical protein
MEIRIGGTTNIFRKRFKEELNRKISSPKNNKSANSENKKSGVLAEIAHHHKGIVIDLKN